MTPTLYFLRSSESAIVTNMLKSAHPDLDDATIYSKHYGLTSKDLGIYALVESRVAGVIWSRELENEEFAIVSFAVGVEFELERIGRAMMQQFLLEAAQRYEHLIIHTKEDRKRVQFLESFGFKKKDNETMQIRLEKQDLIRPSDGYDPRRWMD